MKGEIFMHWTQAQNYFDLSEVTFSDLFKSDEPVWSALSHLSDYLHQTIYPNENKIEGEVCDGAYLVGNRIWVLKGAVVEPGAYVKGPVIIGEDTEVRHGAYIRGNVITGKNCVIGHTTEVKNSIFLNGAKAGHFAYIGDSILGNKVNLGAGTKLANLKIYSGPIKLRYQGSIVETGLRKLGAILGDGAELGCNSVTNPGTFLGKRSIVYPCTAVKGCHADKSMIKC